MNLKKFIFKSLLLASIVYIFKSLLISFIPEITNTVVVLSYILGLSTKIIFNLLDDFINLDQSLYIIDNDSKIPNIKLDLNSPLLSDNGEGSSKNPNTGEESSKDLDITSPDYSWSTDEDIDMIMSDNESELSDPADYPKPLHTLTKEEVKEALKKAEESIEEYKTSGINVPAAPEQIALLEKKVAACKEILEAESSSSSSLDSESKSKETSKDSKGKGKE